MTNDDRNERLRSLSNVGLISYLLHLIVAVGALVPGGQWGPTLLIVALGERNESPRANSTPACSPSCARTTWATGPCSSASLPT